MREGGINGGEAGEELSVEAEGLWDTRGAGGLTDGVHAQLGSANVCWEGGREGRKRGGGNYDFYSDRSISFITRKHSESANLRQGENACKY